MTKPSEDSTPSDSPADRIAEIRARAEAATPGRWLAERRPFAAGIQAWILTATTLPEEANSSAVFLPREDVEFVIHARTDIPWLLDQLVGAIEDAGHWEVAAKLADENCRAAEAETERLRAELATEKALALTPSELLEGAARNLRRALAAEAALAALWEDCSDPQHFHLVALSVTQQVLAVLEPSE